MFNRPIPLIAIGDFSSTIVKSLGSISSLYDCNQNDSVCIDNVIVNTAVLSSSSKYNTQVHILPCKHPYHQIPHQFCQVCSQNYDFMQQTIRNLLEKHHSSTHLLLLIDLGTSFTNWCFDKVLDILSNDFSSFLFGCLLVLPPISISGLDTYYATTTLANALYASHYLILRTPQEYLCEDNFAKVNKPQIIQELSLLIASDLYPCLTSSNTAFSTTTRTDFPLWPMNICMSRQKIIDIRSSLYTNILKKQQRLNKNNNSGNKKAATEDSSNNDNINTTMSYPYRIVASNLHRLDYYYSYHTTAATATLASSEESSTSSSSRPLLACYTEHSIDSNLGYFHHLLPADQDNNSKSMDEVTKIIHHAVAAGSSSHRWSFLPTMTAPTNDGASDKKGGKASKQQPLFDRVEKVSSLVFHSPYGEYEIRRIIQQAKKLLQVNAYHYQYGKDNSSSDSMIEREVIENSILAIESYFAS